MNAKDKKTMFARAMYIMVILATVLSVSTTVYATPSSPFLGQWRGTDPDGSDIRLAIAGRSDGPFQLTWTESYIGFCDGNVGIIRGTGWLNESNSNLLEADLHLECLTTGATLDFHLIWRYHTTTNMLSSSWNGIVTIWHRPGGGQIQEPPVLGLRVNYGHDWVESFYEGGHTAWITVNDSDGNVKATAELITEPKDFWGGETGFQTRLEDWNPAPPDIQPYDWVYGWMDNGASAQVQIGDISGMIDLANDSIGGTVNASWFTEPVQVECLDWGSGREPPLDNKDGGSILPNGSESYACSWSGEWDILPEQNLGVGYLGPDGNWVANAFLFPMPTFVAYFPYIIEGYDWPMGDEIKIFINDVEFPVTAISEQRPGFPEGSTRVLFDVGGGGISLQASDRIIMTDEAVSITKEVWVTNLAVTDFDLNAGKVFGTYDPSYNLWVWLYDLEGQAPETEPDNGIWVATFTELSPEALGGATQWDMDGDGTSIDFQVPNTRVVIANQPDWVNSGINVSVGQSFAIEAFGLMNPCSDTYPNGADYCIFYTPLGAEGVVSYENEFGVFPGPGLRFMALLGRIGDGVPFYIGTSGVFTAEQTGTLWLTPNDNLRTDNQGAYSVLVWLEQ